MIKEGKNQSIIVSGESGAGKTQSAKYIMRYFATVDDLEKKFNRADAGQGNAGGTSEIEEAVLSTNPIMELCAAVPAAERKELGLGRWSDYYYLNQGGTGTIPGFDDAAEFAVTQQALSTIGISVSTQWDEALVADDDPALIQATKLLGLNKNDFKKWIVKKQIITRSEKIVTSLNQYQATVGRDSVAKFIYSMLFDWLVKIINKNLARDEQLNQTFIGVLDIYGFEHFKKNSFEQFCINYANEKLQQEFNQHVFKLEQEEYINEKINWSFIDFNDNQPCIDMIENKLGILDLLDEESRLPSGSDGSLITKLYQRFAVPTQTFFEKPRFGQKAFTIKHYACDVTYEIDGFIEKNKDTVSDEQLSLLNSAEFAFLKEVVTIEEEVPQTPVEVSFFSVLFVVNIHPKSTRPSGRMGGSSSKKPTLGSIFKASLVKLMATLRTTEVHYIRCIKPNQSKTAFVFEPQMVLAQLRACGVLETIRISCAGYPSRWTYQEFADRYYLLVPSKTWSTDSRALTSTIVSSAITAEDKYQMGLTKIFFRAGQLAFLEKLRSEKLRDCVVLIQKNIRRMIYRNKYRRMRKAAIKIQTAERERIAATKIQKQARMWLARRKFLKIRSSVVKIQSTYRMHVAQKELMRLRRERAALRIQKVYRGHLTRKWYRRTRRQIILLQSCTRRRRAIKELKVLKTEARSVGKLKELNYKLENKVIELSQTVKARDEEMRALLDKISTLEGQVTNWKEKFSRVETNSKAATIEVEQVSSEMKAELKALQESRDQLTKENEKLTTNIGKKDSEIESLQNELSKLREENKKLREDIKSLPKAEDAATTASLRKEVASLREQMSKLIAGKWTRDRVADSLIANAESGGYAFANESAKPSVTAAIAPASISTGASDYSSQLAYTDASTTVSSGDAVTRTNRKSTISHRTSLATSETAVSVASGEERTLESERSVRTLEDKALEDEIIDSLITNLRIPLPSTQTVATRKEIFFPAHLIGTVMMQLLQHDLSQRMFILMGNVIKAIQSLTMKFEDDYVSAFWLSNCFELLCVVKAAQEKESRKFGSRRPQAADATEAERALDKVRTDLDYLLVEIYHGWIKELKKRLANMIVPAVIENQSLPGYVCCFLLNPTQIKKLLSLYYAADFDSPLSPELLKIVASRAVLNEKSDVLLLDLEQSPDFTKPMTRAVEIEKFIPAWISLPHISAIVSAS
ncbi:Myosin type-2 heavy chain 1 [Phlyctochytrium bullatum]|nr:Myosin type-2 heavy chain 1 [Phlyctochytrium bullatum]